MSRSLSGFCLLVWLGTGALARAQPGLPRAEEVTWPQLREHGRNLLQALAQVQGPLPPATRQALNDLLREEKPTDPQAAVEQVQQLLDPHCLVGVSINPQSRVKAQRGPAVAQLIKDRSVVFLLKVFNDAGVTNALTLTSPQFRTPTGNSADQWLEAVLYTDKPLARTLAGQRLEYVVVRLTARAVGKREATLKFDVGQGTQDLGFRAEVPILFSIRKEEGR